MTSYERRKAAEAEADLQTIEGAKANGFMDCRAIRDALGFDYPKANGSYYSSTCRRLTASLWTLGKSSGLPYPGWFHRRSTKIIADAALYGLLPRRVMNGSRRGTENYYAKLHGMTNGRRTWHQR